MGKNNLNYFTLIIKQHSKFLIITFLIQCCFAPSLFSNWFSEDRYYEISYKFSSEMPLLKSMTIGKPWSDGPFTVYISYPDKKEVRIKTAHILKIVDTGTKSPDQIKKELMDEIAKIFGNSIQDVRKSYSLKNINLARSIGISDYNIYEFLCSIDESCKRYKFKPYQPIEKIIPPSSAWFDDLLHIPAKSSSNELKTAFVKSDHSVILHDDFTWSSEKILFPKPTGNPELDFYIDAPIIATLKYNNSTELNRENQGETQVILYKNGTWSHFSQKK